MRDIIENKEIKVNEKNIIPLAEVKEESDVTLNLELYKNNIPFDVTGQSIKLGVLINNELIGEQSDGITINKNVVTIKLKNSFIQAGKLELDLTLTDNTGRMTTSSFYLIVNKKTIGGTNIQGTDLLETLDKVVLYFKVNSQKAIDGFVAESTELLSDIKKNGEKTISDIKSNYDSLKQIIINQNQAANLQNQINQNKQQSSQNTNRIEQLEDLTPVWQEHEGRGDITVNDSFDGSTKDLTIKGRTLFNTVTSKNGQGAFGFDSNLKVWANKAGKLSGGLLCKNVNLKPNTTYTIIYNVLKNLDDSPLSLDSHSSYVAKDNIDIPREEGIQKKAFSTKETFDGITEGFVLKITTWNKAATIEAGSLVIDNKIIILEGDWTNEEVFREYFDSITSSGESEDNKIIIKSVGKNLANIETILKDSRDIELDGEYIKFHQGEDNFILRHKYKPNTQYTISGEWKSYTNNRIQIVVGYTDGTNSMLDIDTTGGFKAHTTLAGKTVRLIKNNRASYNYLSGVKNFQLEENAKATNYEQYRAKLIEIPLPFAKGLKSTLDGTIYDEINISKGEIIQRVSEEYTELPKENIYKIPKDYLRFFNGTTNILQENNITSILKFEYPLNKDASIVSGLLINDILESEIKNNNNNISELNTKLTENKNDIDYLDSKITTSTNNITTLNSNVTTNTNSINNLKTELAKHNIQTNPLWEGASFLAAGQELTLNKSLDNCRNGVVLVWSQYNTSTDVAINERFAFVFIRKNTIVQNVNKSFGCLIANTGDRVSSYDHIITKYVNVSGTRVVGWRGNNQYQNAQSVLRAVYEW